VLPPQSNDRKFCSLCKKSLEGVPAHYGLCSSCWDALPQKKRNALVKKGEKSSHQSQVFYSLFFLMVIVFWGFQRNGSMATVVNNGLLSIGALVPYFFLIKLSTQKTLKKIIIRLPMALAFLIFLVLSLQNMFQANVVLK